MKSKRSGKSLTDSLVPVRDFLDEQVARFNTPAFIPADPVSIPHKYQKLQDREIAGFWTAILSWGLRKTILQKANALFGLMGESPHDFILHHRERDRKRFLDFRHRTFQPLDTLYFLEFFQQYYRRHSTLEDAFLHPEGADEMKTALGGFHDHFFALAVAPQRTRKHVPTPHSGSSCKRVNMFLRWMVRKDDCGVDFGDWNRLKMHQLMIPLDVHVQKVAVSLGLLSENDSGWKAVEKLTCTLRSFDPADPVKYDFALFGMGVLGEKVTGKTGRKAVKN